MKRTFSYPFILIGLLSINLIFSLFSYIFHFADSNIYQSIFFGLFIFNAMSFGLLVMVEAISLKFDRTATRPTLFAIISLLISYLLSNDMLFAVRFTNNTYHEIVPTIFLIIHQIFLFGFVLFLFIFLENDYKLKQYKKIHLISFGILVILITIFSLTKLFIATIIVATLSFIYVSIFTFIYLRSLKDKNDITPALISLVMTLAASASLPINVLYLKDLNLVGVPTLLFIIPAIGYLLVYLDFVIKKTKTTYEYEDQKKEEEEKRSHHLVVKCFHSFSVKYDDKELVFPSRKSKEFFALLIMLRGSSLTLDKAITYLWPDKDVDKAKGLYRNTIMKLRDYFDEIKCNYITFKRAETYLDTSNIECDYYDVINKKEKYDNSPLMPEYDWSLEFENILK